MPVQVTLRREVGDPQLCDVAQRGVTDFVLGEPGDKPGEHRSGPGVFG